ncbi:MAG: hypothetical protein WCA17_13655, partial [Burkholderiales bacterium]
MRLARRLLQSLLILGLATGSALAQLTPGYGLSPNALDQGSPQSTPLRTPLITNSPVAPAVLQVPAKEPAVAPEPNRP